LEPERVSFSARAATFARVFGNWTDLKARRRTPTGSHAIAAYFQDISWVDSTTQKYYLADRMNNAIDLVDAATDIFIGLIGKGQYKLLISSRLAR